MANYAASICDQHSQLFVFYLWLFGNADVCSKCERLTIYATRWRDIAGAYLSLFQKRWLISEPKCIFEKQKKKTRWYFLPLIIKLILKNIYCWISLTLLASNKLHFLIYFSLFKSVLYFIFSCWSNFPILSGILNLPLCKVYFTAYFQK